MSAFIGLLTEAKTVNNDLWNSLIWPNWYKDKDRLADDWKATHTHNVFSGFVVRLKLSDQDKVCHRSFFLSAWVCHRYAGLPLVRCRLPRLMTLLPLIWCLCRRGSDMLKEVISIRWESNMQQGLLSWKLVREAWWWHVPGGREAIRIRWEDSRRQRLLLALPLLLLLPRTTSTTTTTTYYSHYYSYYHIPVPLLLLPLMIQSEDDGHLSNSFSKRERRSGDDGRVLPPDDSCLPMGSKQRQASHLLNLLKYK